MQERPESEQICGHSSPYFEERLVRNTVHNRVCQSQSKSQVGEWQSISSAEDERDSPLDGLQSPLAPRSPLLVLRHVHNFYGCYSSLSAGL
jgi:hypothetical protein